MSGGQGAGCWGAAEKPLEQGPSGAEPAGRGSFTNTCWSRNVGGISVRLSSGGPCGSMGSGGCPQGRAVVARPAGSSNVHAPGSTKGGKPSWIPNVQAARSRAVPASPRCWHRVLMCRKGRGPHLMRTRVSPRRPHLPTLSRWGQHCHAGGWDRVCGLEGDTHLPPSAGALFRNRVSLHRYVVRTRR